MHNRAVAADVVTDPALAMQHIGAGRSGQKRAEVGRSRVNWAEPRRSGQEWTEAADPQVQLLAAKL